MKLLTNNPKFINYEMKNLEIDYRDVDYLQILKDGRDYVHKNYELLTHPLYGSVKPNETVYRSLVLQENTKLDVNSVNLISDAIQTFIKFEKNEKTPNWTENILDDFSVIDYDLIHNALQRIL